jgi:hypothetical protein
MSPATHGQTPAWLRAAGYGTGGAGRVPPPAALPPPVQQTAEAWCKQRLEAIAATAAGSDAVPGMKRVMDSLGIAYFDKQRNVMRQARRDKWVARARARKALADLRKLQREMLRIDAHSNHLDAKISRLISYSQYIERGWKEDPADVAAADASSGAGSRSVSVSDARLPGDKKDALGGGNAGSSGTTHPPALAMSAIDALAAATAQDAPAGPQALPP